jgi:hypothetical protein
MSHRRDPILIALDLNASRVRGLCGPAGTPQTLPLDEGHEELPLALSLQGRSPEVGRAGLALARRAPHLACLDFLPALGTPRRWRAERHQLDAGQALGLVLQRLQPRCHGARGLVLAVPAYLSAEQLQLLFEAVVRARLPLVGSVPAPLAAALAAHAQQPWYGPAVVVDVDDHALTLLALTVSDGQAQVLDSRPLPHLGLRVWKDCLLAAVADRCIRQSRRDPRDNAAAEQTLYDHLEGMFEACRQRRLIELAIQTPHWYQQLILQAEEVVQFCAPLRRQVGDALEAVQAATKPYDAPRVLLVTVAAARLPGLVATLQSCLANLAPRSDAPPTGDFGEGLLDDDPSEAAVVTVLAADAAARAAHDLATRFLSRELPAGHLAQQAPLLLAQPVDAGPARLQFGGRDFLLDRPSFLLGRQPTCDLVFDSDTYPTVSGRHCEIVLDGRGYTLCDRSRHGTLVNEQMVAQPTPLSPGDWIRLGPDGPVLRFLGQAAGPRRLITTA